MQTMVVTRIVLFWRFDRYVGIFSDRSAVCARLAFVGSALVFFSFPRVLFVEGS